MDWILRGFLWATEGEISFDHQKAKGLWEPPAQKLCGVGSTVRKELGKIKLKHWKDPTVYIWQLWGNFYTEKTTILTLPEDYASEFLKRWDEWPVLPFPHPQMSPKECIPAFSVQASWVIIFLHWVLFFSSARQSASQMTKSALIKECCQQTEENSIKITQCINKHDSRLKCLN